MNHRLNRSAATVLLALPLSVAAVLGTADLASAHTPKPSISCSGISIGGTAYGAKGADWTLTVNGASTSGHFGDSGSSPVVQVPQDGKTSTWSYSIKAVDGNAAGSKKDSGSVGPCGTPPVVIPPKPEPVVTHDSSDETVCTDDTVVTHHTTTTTGWVLDEKSNTWVKGEPVTTKDADTTRPATDTECPPVVVVPPKPADVVKLHTSEDAANCDTKTVTIHHATTTIGYVYDEPTNTWVQGTTSTVKNPDTTRPATAQECPVVVVVPPVQPPTVVPPVVSPQQPIPHVVHPLLHHTVKHPTKPAGVDVPRTEAKPAAVVEPGVLPNTGTSGLLTWLTAFGVGAVAYSLRLIRKGWVRG